MEWTAHTRGTARTVAAAGAALVAGGVAAVRTVHASAPARSRSGPRCRTASGASNRAR